MRGYQRWLPDDYRILVLVDRDRDECRQLKGHLEQIAEDAGFSTRTHRDAQGRYQVISRLAIEELEAWFFGDIVALCAAYPGISPTLAQQRGYRDPDAIRGGTEEALLRVLHHAGYYTELKYYPKKEVADAIATCMEPELNRSASFRRLCNALREL